MIGTVEEVLEKLNSQERQKTIDRLIRYGKHLDEVRKKEEFKDVISSDDVIKYLIEHGMPLDLALEIKQSIATTKV
jgi:hypothetical protein